ncbi:MAG TPA: hypothetical protein VEZ42_08730 [Pseudonocardia sp.]|nr:hypothetical protein [Pseudonocardia sp.]
MDDRYAHLAHARRVELERAAADARLRRACRSPARGASPLLRVYARLWWASRPRVGAWGPPPSAVDGPFPG